MPNPEAPPESKAPAAEKTDDDQAAARYLAIKKELEADPGVAKGPRFPEIRAELDGIANGAQAAPMRANAALLLGSAYDARGESLKASGYYRHAATLVPDDAGPHMALAATLATVGDLPGAIAAQEQAAKLDPDNLENWLALGELQLRAGNQEGSVQAYVSYELRRKGLIDGLTLHDEEGTYVVGVDERIACARALAAAADQGTAVALIYALRKDPEPRVRAAIAEVMGVQRLDAYLAVLQAESLEESEPETKEAIAWAMAEITRDPVKIEPTERPRLPSDDPRATEAELPRADSAPVAPTDTSTTLPKGGAPSPKGGALEGGDGESLGNSGQKSDDSKTSADPSPAEAKGAAAPGPGAAPSAPAGAGSAAGSG